MSKAAAAVLISRTMLSWLGVISPESRKGTSSTRLSTVVITGCPGCGTWPVTAMRTLRKRSPSSRSSPPRPSMMSLPPPPRRMLPEAKEVTTGTASVPSIWLRKSCRPVMRAMPSALSPPFSGPGTLISAASA
ncbi:hypothetical protein D3C85_1526600 [compost metagenome]